MEHYYNCINCSVCVLSTVHSVVCHQLGFGPAIIAYRNSYFGDGSLSIPIWLGGVRCASTNRYLSECNHNGWGDEDCTHSEEAGVACASKYAERNLSIKM